MNNATPRITALQVIPVAGRDSMTEVVKVHRLYMEDGLGARDDSMATQYLIPGWKFNPERPALDR